MTINQALFTSKSQTWTTPDKTFRELDDEFHFTIDVAASAENTKCARFYDEAADGLSKSWAGEVVWCNPPYNNIAAWVEKAYNETFDEGAATVVMLIPSRTDTRYFHDWIYEKPGVEVRFIKGRLKFGDATASAPFPSMIVVFR